jgi:predicted DNA-binding transcriptional regulator YafY
MGDRLKLERFIWFHGRVRDGRYPNAKDLAGHFEISSRTSQRDVEFMRERLNAPLEYDAVKKGYYYTDRAYELPARWFNEENIMALALAVRLASSIPDTGIKKTLCSFLNRVFSLQSGDAQNCIEGISEKVSVKNIEYSRVDEEFFHEITDSLFRERPVVMAYYSPHTGKKSVRTVLPLHLIHYMGSWHIVAYCASRKGLRNFALSRIRDLNRTTEEIVLPPNLPSIKEYCRRHFGIMQGGRTTEVRLKFAPSVSEWMAEQVWHPGQQVSFEADGSLIMRFPVADFREIRRRILGHGAEVKVLEPRELAKEIREEIVKMRKNYGEYDTE